MRGSRQTRAEEIHMKLLKMHGLVFEVLKLADSSDMLSAFHQRGPLASYVVLETSFKIWAWIFSHNASNNVKLLHSDSRAANA